MHIPPIVQSAIRLSLEEDFSAGDVTSEAVFSDKSRYRARVIAKSPLVLAGMPFFVEVFHQVDSSVKIEVKKAEGSRIKPKTTLSVITGPTLSILRAERTALNILQRLCGTATLTRAFADKLAGLPTRLADTRKTTPLMRFMQKYAVRIGGGHNHRYNLSDGVLLKDNHISAAGGIKQAVKAVRAGCHHMLKVEVEVKTVKELQEALRARADIIMLDNMSPEEVRTAVKLIDGQAVVEVSGGISLQNIRSYAEAGADIVSVGALTHSAPAADISLDFIKK